jgi:hypothetical protein
VSLAEHGVGRAGAWREAQVDPQPSAAGQFCPFGTACRLFPADRHLADAVTMGYISAPVAVCDKPAAQLGAFGCEQASPDAVLADVSVLQ